MRIKKLKPVPVVLGVIIVGLAAISVRAEGAITRLRISDIAIFLTVIFFYILQRDDTKELEKRVEELEDLV